MSEESSPRPDWLKNILSPRGKADAAERERGLVQDVMMHLVGDSNWARVDQRGEADIHVPEEVRKGKVTVSPIVRHTEKREELFSKDFRNGCCLTFWLDNKFFDPRRNTKLPSEQLDHFYDAIVELYGLENVAMKIHRPSREFLERTGYAAPVAVVLAMPKGSQKIIEWLDKTLLQERNKAQIRRRQAGAVSAGPADSPFNQLLNLNSISHEDMVIRDLVHSCHDITPTTITAKGMADVVLPQDMQTYGTNGKLDIHNVRLSTTKDVHGTVGLALWMDRKFYDGTNAPSQEQKQQLRRLGKELADALNQKYGLHLTAHMAFPKPLRQPQSPSQCVLLLSALPAEVDKLHGVVQQDLQDQKSLRADEFKSYGGGHDIKRGR